MRPGEQTFLSGEPGSEILNKTTVVIGLFFFLPYFVLMSGCGETEAERALRLAKELHQTNSLSDTEVIRNLQASERMLDRLVRVKIQAAEWRIRTLRRLIDRYMVRNMWPEAAREIEKLIELQPTNADWYFRKGQIYSQWARVEEEKAVEARQAFEVALQLEPDHLKARYGLGVVHAFRLENIEQGRRYLEQVGYETEEVVKKRETIKNARFALGRLEHQEGNFTAAVEALEAIVEMRGVSSDSRFFALKNIGQIYEETGSAGLAREYYLRANRLYGRDPEVNQALERLGGN